ncbi:MAG: GDSL-type esterase/lipase family protein [Bacteroidales bacterium]|jgi:lysophospholipase L1-like esterase|nr:GDSL-type esterase/lipase family protein [Bacteroidales bacterium]
MNLLLMCISFFGLALSQITPTNSPHISYMGRFDTTNSHEYICSFPASSISIHTNSQYVYAYLRDYAIDTAEPNYIEVIVDDSIYATVKLSSSEKKRYVLAKFPDRKLRTISLVKRTEGQIGNMGFLGFECEKDARFSSIPTGERNMLFIGNSITCGYGNEAHNAEQSFTAKTENAYMSYAAIAARSLNAEYHLIAYSGKGIYRNWEDTLFNQDCMPEVFRRTLALKPSAVWSHSRFFPDIFVINLGTNDFSPPLGAQKKLYIRYYLEFLTYLLAQYPQSQFVLVSSQMLEGENRANQITWLQEIVQKINSLQVSVCVLSQQGSVGYGADWHPNVAQNKINAQELVSFIRLEIDKK